MSFQGAGNQCSPQVLFLSYLEIALKFGGKFGWWFPFAFYSVSNSETTPLNWLPPKAQEPSIPCYLIPGEERDVFMFFTQRICELETRLEFEYSLANSTPFHNTGITSNFLYLIHCTDSSVQQPGPPTTKKNNPWFPDKASSPPLPTNISRILNVKLKYLGSVTRIWRFLNSLDWRHSQI